MRVHIASFLLDADISNWTQPKWNSWLSPNLPPNMFLLHDPHLDKAPPILSGLQTQEFSFLSPPHSNHQQCSTLPTPNQSLFSILCPQFQTPASVAPNTMRGSYVTSLLPGLAPWNSPLHTEITFTSTNKTMSPPCLKSFWATRIQC